MVKIKKTIVEKVRSLNDSGVLLTELRLPGVATPLAQLEDETTALEILTGLEEQADTIDDPTKWVQEAAKGVLQRWKAAEEEVEVEAEGEQEWAEGAAPPSRHPDCKPGDWYCPNCKDLQFAKNVVCRMCGADKPGGGKGGGKRDWESPAPGGKKRKMEEVERSSGGKPGDWTCVCGDLQFAKNVSCRSCGRPKPPAGKGGGGGKPGDWTCPSCGDLVFARNQACRSCNTPRPASGGKGKPGDWSCPSCGDFQFARNEVCRSCNAPRPASAEQSFRAAARPGDWECPKCGDLQFARNTQCRQCGAPRPDDDDE